jgi:hypothetical protein
MSIQKLSNSILRRFCHRAASTETVPAKSETELSTTDALNLAILILKEAPDFETNIVCTRDNPVRPLRAQELLPVLERALWKNQGPTV